MKRPKYKIFKRHIDLIRYAVGRAIHRSDHGDSMLDERLMVLGTSVENEMKKANWLQWAGQKLKGLR